MPDSMRTISTQPATVASTLQLPATRQNAWQAHQHAVAHAGIAATAYPDAVLKLRRAEELATEHSNKKQASNPRRSLQAKTSKAEARNIILNRLETWTPNSQHVLLYAIMVSVDCFVAHPTPRCL